MSTIYSEYNTDSFSGTYDRLQQLARQRSTYPKSEAAPLSVSQQELTCLIRNLFEKFQSHTVAGLAERAMSRLQQPGRWKEMSCSSLICEIVTNKLVRKGPLSDKGRHERCGQIQHAAERGGARFAILLLPFRAPSPLKHRGILPDMGEIYTLVLLQSIARACEHAQESMIAKAKLVAAQLTDAQLRSYGSRSDGPLAQTKNDHNRIMARAFAIIDAQSLADAETAKRKQCVRASLFNLKSHHIRDANSFGELLAALSEWSLSLEAFAAFLNADLVPVTILAIQDADRYPCYANLDRTDVAKYRLFLLRMIELLSIEPRHLQLIDYADVAGRLDEATQRTRDAFYASRLKTLLTPLAMGLQGLLSCRGKEEFMRLLQAADTDGVVALLFEPILLSIRHPAIVEHTMECGRDFDDVFFEYMASIYESRDATKSERLRRRVIWGTLEAASQYCAAYEANTGSKNLDGFDDVTIRFPATLRMSIHSKDEGIGHFSVLVSPTKTRTPWHGTATVNCNGSRAPIDLSIDLAEDLELAGKYRPVLVEVENSFEGSALFEWHAQPATNVLSGDKLGAGGAIGTTRHDLVGTCISRFALFRDIDTVPQFERQRIAVRNL
jgi:hypothetical protein